MIYLNNSATSYPKPQSVVDAVTACLTTVPVNPSRSGFEVQGEDAPTACRQKLAAFFHAEDPDRIIFTSGATESLNMAIFGLPLTEGHVITTAIEHTSVLRPLKTLEKEVGLELTIVESDSNGFVDPANIAANIQANTKAIVVNHCSNVTGQVLDIKSMADIAHKHGLVFVVDGSQSAGNVPIDITETGIDIFVFTGHKSLYGMPGVGGMYISEGVALKPLKVGGTGVKSELLSQPKELPLYYESGTHNFPGIVSMAAGIDFIQNTGLERLNRTKHNHLKRLTEELQNIPEITIYGSDNFDNRCAVFCFNMVGISPPDLGYILEGSFGIIARAGLHCAPLIHQAMGAYPHGSLRVSPSYFTTTEEIDFFVKAIQEISVNIQHYENY